MRRQAAGARALGGVLAALVLLVPCGSPAADGDSGAPPAAPKKSKGLKLGNFVLGAGVHSFEDPVTLEKTSAAALSLALDYKPPLKEFETESFVMSYSAGWGVDGYFFNTLAKSGDDNFYRQFNLNVFGAYYIMKELPGGQLVTSFALRARVDEAKLASDDLAVATLKPELWLELPFTDQKKSRVGPVTLYLGYALADDFVNDKDLDEPYLDSRWEIDLEWPFLRGKWGGEGLESIEAAYRGSFFLFDEGDDYSFNMLGLKVFVGEKSAITIDIGAGQRPPDFLDTFLFSVGYKSAF